MKLPELIPARLVRRYKRFLADVILEDGRELTAHCPNTGAMTGCAVPGAPVWLSVSDNPKRKYAHTWELVETDTGIVSVNTGRANHLVAEALSGDVGAGLFGTLDEVRAEVAIPAAPGEKSQGRFDFCAQQGDQRIWIEVKSVTLMQEPGVGAFPDAVSERALKHVHALLGRIQAAPNVERGVLLFCAQHCGVETVCLAEAIDPVYSQAVRDAHQAGLEVHALGCATDLSHFTANRTLPVAL